MEQVHTQQIPSAPPPPVMPTPEQLQPLHDEPTIFKLDTLEDIVNQALRTYFEVGKALDEINRRELYKERGKADFESYCRDRFGFSVNYAYRQIAAYKVAGNLPIGKRPRNEAQARELGKLAPDQQREIAQGVDFETITAAELRQLVDQLLQTPGALTAGPLSVALYEDGTNNSKAEPLSKRDEMLSSLKDVLSKVVTGAKDVAKGTITVAECKAQGKALKPEIDKLRKDLGAIRKKSGKAAPSLGTKPSAPPAHAAPLCVSGTVQMGEVIEHAIRTESKPESETIQRGELAFETKEATREDSEEVSQAPPQAAGAEIFIEADEIELFTAILVAGFRPASKKFKGDSLDKAKDLYERVLAVLVGATKASAVAQG